MQIAIIGAGAAGCFAAVNIKSQLPDANVTVYESHRHALAKVAITGGGRCNLTNSFRDVKSIDSVYPRGARLMKRLLREFSHEDAYKWFENNGVRLVVQDDQCVFPKSQDAMEIVNTLLRLMSNNGVVLNTNHRVGKITECDAVKVSSGDTSECVINGNTQPRYRLTFTDEKVAPAEADVVVVTTGGSPRMGGFDMFSSLNLEIIPPVPSLFSICLPGNSITELTGTVVENVTVTLTGTKIKTNGPLLITHWGMSGPAILKLSSHAARLLNEKDYKAQIAVNWLGDMRENDALEYIGETAVRNPQKQLQSVYPNALNARLWQYLIAQSGLRCDQRWAELGKKSYNRLASTLTNHLLDINGKNRFKDEFVTCGGIALSNVNPSTLECRNHKGLYFAGEILDVDAVTGGFNLQAAWTMGYVVAKAIAAQ